jgi:hypothetical protein
MIIPLLCESVVLFIVTFTVHIKIHSFPSLPAPFDNSLTQIHHLKRSKGVPTLEFGDQIDLIS